MNKRNILIRVIPIAIAGVFVLMQFFSSEKFTNEAGRTAHLGLTRGQEEQLGLQSYQKVLDESKTINSGPQVELVKRVAARLEAATGAAASGFNWQVSVVDSPEVNAFCLPGGKIVVYTGILPVAQGESGLATVLGHEMAHATARHGSERVFKQQAEQTIMGGVQASISDMDYDKQRVVMGALGAGAQYGILMPFSREHESEADKIGLLYMARAGYDPRLAIAFWERMSKQGGNKPPEFLSTHPADRTRIEQLRSQLPEAMKVYEASGKQTSDASL